MKESEFLELLNLYLDHEISTADAARLEAEVQSNPARRAVYRDYCRMQKACKMLAADLQVESAEDRAVSGRGKLVAGDASASRPTRPIGIYLAASTALAAACVILLLTISSKPGNGNGGGQPTPSLAGVSENPPAGRLVTGPSSGQRGLVAASKLSAERAGARVTLVGTPLVLSGGNQVELAAPVAVSDADDQLAWVRNFQLVSMQERKKLEEFRFEVAPATLRPEARPLGGRPATDATVEMAAFRFIK